MSGGSNQQYPPMGGGMREGVGGPVGPGQDTFGGGTYRPENWGWGGGISEGVGGLVGPGRDTFGGGWGGGMPPRRMPPMNIPGQRPSWPGMGGGQGDPNRPVPAVMPPGWQSGEQGGGSWNGPAPPGFTHAGGAATMALEDFINPTTGQKWTASHGGYQPPPGWQRVGGGGFQAKPGGGMGGGMRGGFGNWAGLGKGFSEDQFMKARSFADRGKMGRAKQAIEQGGGQWSDQLHGLLGSPSGRWGNMGWDTMY